MVARVENGVIYVEPDWDTWREGYIVVIDLMEELRRSVQEARAEEAPDPVETKGNATELTAASP